MTGKNNKKIFLVGAAIFVAAIFVAAILPAKTHAAGFDPLSGVTIVPIYQTLKETTGIGGTIKSVWNNILNLINGLVVVLLIMVAFAQILRININTYGVKKILPVLILAVIGANFSYLFCRLVVDFANAIMAYLIQSHTATNLTQALNGGSDNAPYGWASPKNTGNFPDLDKNWATVFWFLIFQFMLLASGVLIYILDFLFFIRIWLIYFLVPIAPLAFMALPLPQTKQYFNQWWSLFAKWAFMPVVSLFWIWLGAQWLHLVPGSWLMPAIFGGVCFYMAIKSPFSLGGKMMESWAGYGKKVGKWGLDRSGATGAYDYMKQKGQLNYASRKQGIYNKVKETTGLGTGLDVANARSEQVKSRQSALSGRAKSSYNSSEKAQAALQRNVNIEGEGKEFEAQGKKVFTASEKGKRMLAEQIRSETRTAKEAKDTEAALASIKNAYYDNANPDTKSAVNAELKAEVQAFLNASSDAVTAAAEVEKTEKKLTQKLMGDRMAYDNTLQRQKDATKAIAKAVAAGDATAEARAKADLAVAKKAQADIETQIAAGTSWATKGHEMTSTERSRMQAKTDQFLNEEAQIDLLKDGDTIEDEMFERDATGKLKFAAMLAQKPHLVDDTQMKIDFLAKNKAVDKIMASRTGGAASVEAKSMGRKLAQALGDSGMDAHKEAALVEQIIKSYNEKTGQKATGSTFKELETVLGDAVKRSNGSGPGGKTGEVHTMALLTAMRSKLTMPRESGKI